jgi:transcriptional regulator with XRE-family HTH domain
MHAGIRFPAVAHYYLRTIREQHGLTQAQLADKSHVAQNSISRLERGRTRPTFQTALALASALGIAPETLRFGRDPRRRHRPEDARRRYSGKPTPPMVVV